MDWFRWHHGAVTDPKFQLVARKAGASLPDVLAVWAFILEAASSAADRGSLGEIDAESLDCLFGFPSTETRTADILRVLEERGLIADGRIAAWEKRQPKREREDETAAERKRRQRERDATQSTVTPSHATSHQKKPRGEEKREESSVPKGTGGDAASPEKMTKDELWAAGKSLLMQSGMPKGQCGSFVGKLVKDYGDVTVIEAVRAAVVARPADPAEYLKACCQKTAGQRGPKPAKPTEDAEQTARMLAERNKGTKPMPTDIRVLADQIRKKAA